MVKDSLAKLYKDSMDVYTNTYAKDSKTKQSKPTKTQIYTDITCRISFETLTDTSHEDAPLVKQQIRVFCSPDVSIPAGSELVITRNGITSTYKCSSKPAIYDSHIEVTAEPVGEYA